MYLWFLVALISGSFLLYLGINNLVITIGLIVQAVANKTNGTLSFGLPILATVLGVVLIGVAMALLVVILL